MKNNYQPKQTHFVVVGNKRNNPFKMNYAIHGNGDIKILWIGGIVSKLEYYDVCAKHFGSLEKYTIVTFDQAGIGNSEPANVLTVKHLALDTLELIDHLKWDKVHVIGFSLGSYIAYELSKLAPERFQTLNLSCPPSFFNYGFHNTFNFLVYRRFIDPILYGIDPLSVVVNSQLSQSFLESPSKIKNGTNKEFLYPLFDKMSKEGYSTPIKSIIQHVAAASFYKLKASHSDRKTLLARRFPISIFIGTNDYQSHWKNVIKTCDIVQPNKIYVCKGSGHLLFTEGSDEYFNHCEQFFSYKQQSTNNDSTPIKKEFLTMSTLEFKSSNNKPLVDNPFAYHSTPWSKLPIIKKFKSLFTPINLRLLLRK